MKTLIGLIICILFVAFFVFNLKTPSNLGLTGDKLMPIPKSPNAVSSQTDQRDKYVQPLTIYGSVQGSQDKIVTILIEMGCKIITRSKVYIHATHDSNIFHFRDDLEFFFNEPKGLIEIRSASRVGYSDLGVNRDRYIKIKNAYEL